MRAARPLVVCLSVLGVALLLARCGSGPREPRLVVLIVVDQMRYDFLTRFSDLYEGGFKTLLEQGAVFEEAYYRHGVTVTAAGHATIATGLHPSHTGLVGNNWWDPEKRKNVNCVADADYAPVGGPGVSASPRSLFADTLGDRLKSADESSKAVAIGGKDRSALLLAGRKADGAFWLSNECGCFVTSSYFGEQAPNWLERLNSARPADRYAGKSWTRLLDKPDLYETLARADDLEAEGDARSFPHKLPAEAGPELYKAIETTPFGDDLLVDAALAVVDAYELGADAVPDLLAVGFSATDRIGHRFGPFSQEAMDHHLRLDRLLGELLAELDRRVGLDNVVFALSADHGAIPLPEYMVSRGEAAQRISTRRLTAAAERGIAARFPGLGRVVTANNGSHLYLDLAKIDAASAPRAEVEEAARSALLELDYVEAVYTWADLNGDPPADDPYWTLFRNSLFEERSPHLFVRLSKFAYPGASGTGHGSPEDYDRHVPVILAGPGVKAGRFKAVAGPEDIAPTLERLLGLPEALEPDGRILDEALLAAEAKPAP